MINLSIDELKLVAKNRGIKDYKNKSEDDLKKILSEPKTKISHPKKRIEDIKKDANPRQIRKSLCNIKIPKNLFKSKIKKDWSLWHQKVKKSFKIDNKTD